MYVYFIEGQTILPPCQNEIAKSRERPAESACGKGEGLYTS